MEKVEEHKHMKEWIRLYKDGKSIREIAREYGVAPTVVKRRILPYVEIRPKSPNMKYAQEWLELYNSGNRKSDIARMYNVSPGIVGSILSKVGVERNGNKQYMHLANDMKEMYSSGKSLREISKLLNVSIQVVANYLEFKGVDRRAYTEACRTYGINDNYFENIDSKEKAFTLGILWEVGNVVYDEGVPRNINISSTNKSLCDYIVNKLYTTDYKIPFSEKDKVYRPHISCAKLTEDLMKIGFSNKGNKKLPVLNNEELMSSFADGLLYSKLTLGIRKVYTKSSDENLKHLLENHMINNIGVDKEAIKEVRFGSDTEPLVRLTLYRKDEMKKVKDYYNELLKMYE